MESFTDFIPTIEEVITSAQETINLILNNQAEVEIA